MKNNVFKFVVIFVAIILLVVSVTAALTNGFTNADPFGWFDDIKSGDQISGITDEIGENLESGMLQSMPSQLNFSAKAFELAKENGQNYIELTIYATVYPENATNKAVDWSVAWADGSDNSNLSEYLTVTPKSDGSNIVSVKCFKPFDKDINIIVTTRDGKFSAICLAKYLGVANNDLEMTTNALAPNGYYQIPATKSFSFEFSCEDFFGDEANLKLSASDSSISDEVFYVCDFTQSWGYEVVFNKETLQKISMKDMSSSCYSYKIEGNSVIITGNKTISSYYSKSVPGLDYRYNYKSFMLTNFWMTNQDEELRSYARINESLFSTSYFTLKVTDTLSNKSFDINFQIISNN